MPLVNRRGNQQTQRTIPEKSEALNYFSIKKRYIRFYLRAQDTSSRLVCDFDSEIDIMDNDDSKSQLKNIQVGEEEEDEIDEEDVEDTFPNFAQNAQFYISGPQNDPNFEKLTQSLGIGINDKIPDFEDVLKSQAMQEKLSSKPAPKMREKSPEVEIEGMTEEHYQSFKQEFLEKHQGVKPKSFIDKSAATWDTIEHADTA